MITLLLLPFFLVSRISVDIDSTAWYYGPEYTYHVKVNVGQLSTNNEPRIPTRAFHVSSTLKCRPRVPDTLNCRFDAARMGAFEESLADLGQNIIEDWVMDEEPFEIKFDRNGVDELIVTNTMTPWSIDAIRAIVNQLNLGVNLKHKQDGTFTTKEKSYIGLCDADVTIIRRPWNEEGGSRDDNFEIIPMNGFYKASGEVVEIVKKRNLKSCEHKEGYYFGSKKPRFSSLESDVTTNMEFSTSRITISDSNFTSHTTNVIAVDNHQKNKKIKLHEAITVSLESISQAKVDIPTIPNPIVASLFVHGDIGGELPEKQEYKWIGRNLKKINF